MLQAEHISKTFTRKHGTVTALDHVSITIKDGEFVAIIGPSGSGKSTLLLALGGMSAPSEGMVTYNSDSVYNWDVSKRAQWRAMQVGFVFQDITRPVIFQKDFHGISAYFPDFFVENKIIFFNEMLRKDVYI